MNDIFGDSSQAETVAEKISTKLLGDKILAKGNADLGKSLQAITRGVYQLTADELMSDDLDMHKIIATVNEQTEKSIKMFQNIIGHHNKLVTMKWDDAMCNNADLETYSISAREMGRRAWVQHGNDWIARFMANFFLHGGATKHHVRFNKKIDSNFQSIPLVKNILCDAMGTSRKLQVLDVGSCYNPLVHSEYAEHMDVVAVDLYPGDESVYQCDFLALTVGPSGSEPIIEDDPARRGWKIIKQLPERSFDVVTMSLVLSYLPSPDQRQQMINKAQRLLRNGDGIHPQCRGLLLIVEKESIFGKVKDSIYNPLHSQASLLNAWKQGFTTRGWELVKYLNLPCPNGSSRRTHAFAVAKSPLESLQDNPSQSENHTLNGFWIKQDFDIVSPHDGRRNGSMAPLFTDHQRLPVGIVGGGIAGAALAVALQKQGLASIVFEKDDSFNERRQGYALTIQQASMTLNDLDLSRQVLQDGATSQRHHSFDHTGQPIGAYGACSGSGMEEDEDEQMISLNPRKALSKHNIHIPRQRLRELMLEKLQPESIRWGKRFASFEQDKDQLEVTFEDGSREAVSVLVGADGVYSKVRRYLHSHHQAAQLTSSSSNPYDLTFLGLMVILGISPLKSSIDGLSLCQRQWLDGTTRIFTMPFNKDWTMWQLSFPMAEMEAQNMGRIVGIGGRSSELAARELKAEALRRCGTWDQALVSILEASDEALISGHPVYDRPLIGTGIPPGMPSDGRVTLIGDAAHPMSPFKGQGANQALLDALHLSKTLFSSDLAAPGRRRVGPSLRAFEVAMAHRVKPKVDKSRDAAIYLHSPAALTVANITRASAAEQVYSEKREVL